MFRNHRVFYVENLEQRCDMGMAAPWRVVLSRVNLFAQLERILRRESVESSLGHRM